MNSASEAKAQPSFDLDRFLHAERARVEVALEAALGRVLPRLDAALRGPVRQGVTTGGKRLRPILCVEAWRASAVEAQAADAAAGETAGEAGDEAIYAVAASLELVHAYSLMHDDLPSMDNAPLRRGLPTPHMTWGEEATTLGGAALIPAAGLEVWEASGRMNLPDPDRRELLRTLARAAGAGGMVGGQALDLEGEGRALGLEELDALHRAKTGALLTASLRMGALAARAPVSRLAALEAYGRAIGLAFQVADDILDATASAEALGKNPSDATLDKSTYVRHLGVEGARAEARKLVAEAIEALADGGVASPALVALARYVVERDR
ncbi:MAG: polyprenyl synthetase family protein [Gemmatimonadales bacterium]|nr:MAG: polyprenyl synthetase family protein [Gemmatimonadales bacterium]